MHVYYGWVVPYNYDDLVPSVRNFVYQLRRISNDAGMPMTKDPYFQRYVSGVDNVEPLFRQLKQERGDLQLVVIILPGKTPVYGELKRITKIMFLFLSH